MRNAIESILTALDRDDGAVAVILYPDLGIREWLIEQVESLVGEGRRILRVAGVEDALAEPARLVLLVPENERAVVLDLDASRDRILHEPGREQPIVLFLLRDGDGQRALANEAPSLRSWISGSDADPEKIAETDVPKERVAFETKHRVTPEAWLAQWRSGALPETASNFRTAHAAMLLEDRGQA